MPTYAVTACLALLCCLLNACSLVKAKGDAKSFYASTVLVGRVGSAIAWDKPLIVAAFARQNGALVPVHYTMLHEAGGYELLVPEGDYLLAAFGDANGNLRLDPGEPSGQYRPGPVAASGSGTVAELNFSIGAEPAELPPGTAVAASVPPTLHSTQAGAIASLDDALFSPQVAGTGYWSPTAFFKSAGGNVYFLEKYDPAKIPVLFVHGVNGTPQEWRYFAERLDRKRFQPWFYYYPSGASLESMSYLLYWKLLNLQRAHRFDKIIFTAHSMGGLVVRNFLSTYASQLPAEKTFVSLSTPWGGDSMADRGVAYSPAVIPSWHDMQAGGRFIGSLYQRPLPANIDYYLFFGHAGRYSILRSSNTDGAVTLASELRPEAQAEARMIYGFDEDHTSILRSPQVFARYAALLDAAAGKSRAAATASGGHVRVSLRYGAATGLAPAEPWLVLTPADPAMERIVLPISAGDTNRQLGPFPPGVYDVGLVSFGHSAGPAQRNVTLGGGQVPALRFDLHPIGALFGYVGADAKQGDNPAGSFREAHRAIRIDAITLSNGRIKRTLVPDQARAELGMDSYLAGKDDAARSAFLFVGLDDGSYELNIEAAGYQPYRKSYQVRAGQFGKLEPIVMTPRRD